MKSRFDENDKIHIQDVLQVREKVNYSKKNGTICVWRLGYGNPSTRAEVVLKSRAIEIYVGEETPAYNTVRKVGLDYSDDHLKHSQFELALRVRSIVEAEPILQALAIGFGTNSFVKKETQNSYSGWNVLSAAVDYMKKEGILFSLDKSTLNVSEAYAVLGGKSILRYFETASDGVNGYVLQCYKDGEEKDRLCKLLGKVSYDNDDSSHPFKIQINKSEMDKVIDILKMNPLNNNERKERKDVNPEDKKVTKWLISANKSFDTIRAFNELRTLDWNQGRFGIKKGDIVYIYLGVPVQKIRVKSRVDEVNLPHSVIDDSKYVAGAIDKESEESYEGYDGNYMRLSILAEYVDSDLFGIEALEEHGIQGRLRTPRILSGESLAYLQRIDVDNNILRFYSNNEVIINEDTIANEYPTIEEDRIDDEEIIGAEREIITKARVNQSRFRQKLIERYGKCALCGMNIKEFLIASHIKPWVESNAKEKTSVENGLLLCPNHDKLFDKGYISFENDGSIIISSLITEVNYELLGISKDMRIDLTDENIPYIEYHRQYKHIW